MLCHLCESCHKAVNLEDCQSRPNHELGSIFQSKAIAVRLHSQHYKDLDILAIAREFSTQIMNQQIDLSVKEFFSLNHAFLGSVRSSGRLLVYRVLLNVQRSTSFQFLAMAVTYIVIMIQFQLAEEAALRSTQ